MGTAELENISVCFENVLDNLLYRFNRKLNGIPISFDGDNNVFNHAFLETTSSSANVNVLLETIVFRPKQGYIMTGIVKKISHDTAKLLVFGHFNAIIDLHRPRMPNELTFNLKCSGSGNLSDYRNHKIHYGSTIRGFIFFAISYFFSV